MYKRNVEAMIKKSSLIVMIIAALEAVFSVLMAISQYQNAKELSTDFFKIMLSYSVEMLFNGATYIIEMIIFYRILRSGRPFTNGNIMAVRAIAALSFTGGVVSALIRYSADIPLIMSFISSAFSIFGAVVFLFFAEIMRYGRLLQNESDETL